MKIFHQTIALLFICLFLNTSYAYSDYSQRYRYLGDPADDIKSAISDLEKFNQNRDNVHPSMLKAFLENKIFPHFDFDTMSSWIAGPYARYMSPQEKIEFQDTFKETFLGSLVKHLGGFDAGTTKLRFSRTRYRNRENATVNIRVLRDDIRPISLEFDMRNNDGKWQIIDIKANGTSAVIFYRNHFISTLKGYDS